MNTTTSTSKAGTAEQQNLALRLDRLATSAPLSPC
jgi:hypothetical protein